MTLRVHSSTLRIRIAVWQLVLLGLQTPMGVRATEANASARETSARETAAQSGQSPAHATETAQPTPTSTAAVPSATEEQADRLFREGLELMRADHCPEAVERFAESDRLDSSAATLMNLAICYEHMNKPATAWRTFVRAVNAAISQGNTELRSQAAEALSKLGPVLTRIRIVTSGSVDSQVIKVNGEPVADYREPIPVDPGEQIVEVSAPGRKPWRVKVLAKGVGTISVEVPPLTGIDQRAPERRTDLRPAAMVAGGLGVVGLTIGAIWAIRAESANHRANEQGSCTADRCDPIAHDLRDTAWDRARVATWATSLGLLAVATGTVLWVVSPGNKSESPQSSKAGSRVAVTPWVDTKANGGGLLVGGRL